MANTTRALVGFLVAPAVPGALTYFHLLWSGYDDSSIIWPLVITFLGYVAAFVIGAPVYLLLQRRGIRSAVAYILIGALIGPAFYVAFEMLTAYPGQFIHRLQHMHGAMLAAAGYSSIATAAFWLISFARPTNRNALEEQL